MTVGMTRTIERCSQEDVTDADELRPSAWRPDNRILVHGLQLAVLAAVIVLWEWGSGPRQDYRLIDQYYVSKPSAILGTLLNWWGDGRLRDNLLITVQTTVLGFIGGVVLGLGFGFALGISPVLARVVHPFVGALYSIPRLALVPLFILWFGIGMGSKLALVASVVGFLVFYSTFAGVKGLFGNERGVGHPWRETGALRT